MDKVLFLQPPFHLLSTDIQFLSSAFDCHHCKMNFAIWFIIFCTHSVFLVFLRKNNNKISYLQIFLVKRAILCVNAIPLFILRRYNNHPPSPNRRMVEGWLGNNVTINSVLAYIYCNVVIVMLCPKVMCNACALLVLCFDYIHSFIVKFVLNQKRINTILNNFLYICNINACSKCNYSAISLPDHK